MMITFFSYILILCWHKLTEENVNHLNLNINTGTDLDFFFKNDICQYWIDVCKRRLLLDYLAKSYSNYGQNVKSNSELSNVWGINQELLNSVRQKLLQKYKNTWNLGNDIFVHELKRNTVKEALAASAIIDDFENKSFGYPNYKNFFETNFKIHSSSNFLSECPLDRKILLILAISENNERTNQIINDFVKFLQTNTNNDFKLIKIKSLMTQSRKSNFDGSMIEIHMYPIADAIKSVYRNVDSFSEGICTSEVENGTGILLITDGDDINPDLTLNYSRQLKSNHHTIYTLSINKETNICELKSAATEPATSLGYLPADQLPLVDVTILNIINREPRVIDSLHSRSYNLTLCNDLRQFKIPQQSKNRPYIIQFKANNPTELYIGNSLYPSKNMHTRLVKITNSKPVTLLMNSLDDIYISAVSHQIPKVLTHVEIVNFNLCPPYYYGEDCKKMCYVDDFGGPIMICKDYTANQTTENAVLNYKRLPTGAKRQLIDKRYPKNSSNSQTIKYGINTGKNYKSVYRKKDGKIPRTEQLSKEFLKKKDKHRNKINVHSTKQKILLQPNTYITEHTLNLTQYHPSEIEKYFPDFNGRRNGLTSYDKIQISSAKHSFENEKQFTSETRNILPKPLSKPFSNSFKTKADKLGYTSSFIDEHDSKIEIDQSIYEKEKDLGVVVEGNPILNNYKIYNKPTTSNEQFEQTTMPILTSEEDDAVYSHSKTLSRQELGKAKLSVIRRNRLGSRPPLSLFTDELTCPNGSWKPPLCLESCHCDNGVSCNPTTGTCPGNCLDGWMSKEPKYNRCDIPDCTKYDKNKKELSYIRDVHFCNMFFCCGSNMTSNTVMLTCPKNLVYLGDGKCGLLNSSNINVDDKCRTKVMENVDNEFECPTSLNSIKRQHYNSRLHVIMFHGWPPKNNESMNSWLENNGYIITVHDPNHCDIYHRCMYDDNQRFIYSIPQFCPAYTLYNNEWGICVNRSMIYRYSSTHPLMKRNCDRITMTH